MSKQEMLEYLKSIGFNNGDLYYPNKMMDSNKTISIKELVERFVEIDKEYNNKDWNIMQILANINIIMPIEDRKKE